MKLDDSPCHLTYCSNIHPGESWEEVRHNLGLHLPAIRAQLSPDRPFGIGLRLSAAAARTLAQPDTLAEFRNFLEGGNFYVFTLNGFPYGKFHGTRVKEQVYRPDWQDPERLQYTNLLADLLAELLPLQPGLNGSISTVPGAFKADVRKNVSGAFLSFNHVFIPFAYSSASRSLCLIRSISFFGVAMPLLDFF